MVPREGFRVWMSGSPAAPLDELEQVGTSLCLSFLFCKMGINAVPALSKCDDNEIVGSVPGLRLGRSKCEQLHNTAYDPSKETGTDP